MCSLMLSLNCLITVFWIYRQYIHNTCQVSPFFSLNILELPSTYMSSTWCHSPLAVKYLGTKYLCNVAEGHPSVRCWEKARASYFPILLAAACSSEKCSFYWGCFSPSGSLAHCPLSIWIFSMSVFSPHTSVGWRRGRAVFRAHPDSPTKGVKTQSRDH